MARLGFFVGLGVAGAVVEACGSATTARDTTPPPADAREPDAGPPDAAVGDDAGPRDAHTWDIPLE